MTSRTPVSRRPRELRRGAPLACAVGAALLAGCGTQDTVVEHIGFSEKQNGFILTRTTVDTFHNKWGAAGDGAGTYSPAVDTLDGDHVVVRGGGRINRDICRSSVVDPKTISRDEYYSLGIISAPGTVHLNYNVDNLDRDLDGRPDGAIVASDHDSLAMLSGYVVMDQITAFFRDVVGDTSRATQTRAELAFYSQAAVGCDLSVFIPLAPQGSAGVSVPILLGDNAAYAQMADMFIILRDAVLSDGAELGLNPGILSHEFGHRIFEHNVFGSDAAFRVNVRYNLGDDAAKKELCQAGTQAEATACTLTPVILSGMNEGTADIFAFTYTGHSDFLLRHSLAVAMASEVDLRDLARAPTLTEDIPIYDESVVNAAQQPGFQFYRLGTLWSRGFYAGIVNPDSGAAPTTVEEHVRLARERYTPAVRRALNRLGEDLVVNFRFDPRQLVRRYIQEVSADVGTGNDNGVVRSAVCQALCDRFGVMDFSYAVNGAPAQCWGTTGSYPASAGSGGFACQL